MTALLSFSKLLLELEMEQIYISIYSIGIYLIDIYIHNVWTT